MPVINSTIKGAGGGGGDEVTAVVQDADRDSFKVGDKVLLNDSATKMVEYYGVSGTLSTESPSQCFGYVCKDFITTSKGRIYRTNSGWAVSTSGSAAGLADVVNIDQNSNYRIAFAGSTEIALFNDNGSSVTKFTVRYPVSTSYNVPSLPFGDYMFTGNVNSFSDGVNGEIRYINSAASVKTVASETPVCGLAFERDGVTYLVAQTQHNKFANALYKLTPDGVEKLFDYTTQNPLPYVTQLAFYVPLVKDGSKFICIRKDALPVVYDFHNPLSAESTRSVNTELTTFLSNVYSQLTGGVTFFGPLYSNSTSTSTSPVIVRAGTTEEKALIYISTSFNSAVSEGSVSARRDALITYDTVTGEMVDTGSIYTTEFKTAFTEGTAAAGTLGLMRMPINLREKVISAMPGYGSSYLYSPKTFLYNFDSPTNEPVIGQTSKATNFGSKSLTGIVSNENLGTDYFGHKKIKVKTVLDPNNPLDSDPNNRPKSGFELTVADGSYGAGTMATVSVSAGYKKQDSVEFVNIDTLPGTTLLPQAGDTAREQYTITNNIGLAALPADYPGATNVETIVGSGDQTMVSLPNTQADFGFERVAFLDQTKQAVRYDDLRKRGTNGVFAFYGSTTDVITYNYDGNMHTRAVDKVRATWDMGTDAANYAVLNLPSEYNDITAAYERVYCVGFVSPEITGTARTLPLFILHDSVNNRDFNVTLSVPTEAANGYTVMVTSGDDTLIGTFVSGDFPPAGVDCCLRLWMRYDGTVTNYIAQVLTKASEHDVTLAGAMTYPMTGDQVSYGYTLTDAERPVFIGTWCGVCANVDPTAISDNINLFNSPAHDIVAEPFALEGGMMTGLCDPYFPKEGFTIDTDSTVSNESLALLPGRAEVENESFDEIAIPTKTEGSISDALIDTSDASLLQGAALEVISDHEVKPILYNGNATSESLTGKNLVTLTGASSRADLMNLYILDKKRKSGRWGEPTNNITLVGGSEGEVDTADFTIRPFAEADAPSFSNPIGFLSLIKDYGGSNAGLGDTKYYEMDVSRTNRFNTSDYCQAFTFLIASGTLHGSGEASMNKPLALVDSTTGNEVLVIYASTSGPTLQVWGTVTKADNTLENLPQLDIGTTEKPWYTMGMLSITTYINFPDSSPFKSNKISCVAFPENGSKPEQVVATSAISSGDRTIATYDKLVLAKHPEGTATTLDIATVGCGAGVLSGKAINNVPSFNSTAVSIEDESYPVGALTLPGRYDGGNIQLYGDIRNYTAVGSPTISDTGVLSLSSPGSLVEPTGLQEILEGSEYSTLEFVVSCTANSTQASQNILLFRDTAYNSDRIFQFSTHNSSATNNFASIRGTSGDNIASVTYTDDLLVDGRSYLIRFTHDLTTWKVSTSDDGGQTWVDTVSVESSERLNAGRMVMGNFRTYAGGSSGYWRGTIDLANTYLKLDGVEVWRAFKKNALLPRETPTWRRNVTTVGSPFVYGTLAYAFSNDNYVTAPFTFSGSETNYELTLNFSAGAWNNATMTLLYCNSALIRFTSTSSPTLRFIANPTSTTAGAVSLTGSTVLSTDTRYWVKVTYDSATGYKLYLSKDGVNFTIEASSTTTTAPAATTTKAYLGRHSSTSAYYFTGFVFLDECYLKKEGVEVWRGAEIEYVPNYPA